MPTIVEQIDSLEPATIRVFRDSDNDVGFREALIFVDGEQVGQVDYKKMIEVQVRPGHHVIHASNRVVKSHEIAFDLEPGQRITFQAINTGGFWFKALMVALCLGVPKMRLELEKPDPLDAKQKSKRGTVR